MERDTLDIGIKSPNPRRGDVIAVWFSCGAASAIAARLTVRLYGRRCRVRVLNTPVDEEGADNRRFLGDVEQWIGVPIEQVVNPDLGTNSARVWSGIAVAGYFWTNFRSTPLVVLRALLNVPFFATPYELR